MTILLKNGHVVDYVNGFEGKKDILIKDGFIRALGDNLECDDKNARVVDCNGLTVIPGICDMHVHLRDPGQTYKEDIIQAVRRLSQAVLRRLRVCRTRNRPLTTRKR